MTPIPASNSVSAPASRIGCAAPLFSGTRRLAGWLMFPARAVARLSASLVNWMRGREDRYRRIMAHVPVVVYSARFRRVVLGARTQPRSPVAEVTLVSPASETLLGRTAGELLGDHERWLQHVHPDDREVVRAAVAQMDRQEQAVACEYRLAGSADRGSCLDGSEETPAAKVRWLRDTLTPRRDADGQLLGWQGVLTDITEQRLLADDLRRTTGMLHALVGNLPAGVFFVQGPLGQSILVNARARQLLGQRENLAAGLEHLSEVYRLHRPDGSLYPVEELPVYLALRKGLTTMRDDIVVHRPDGRRTPLVTWAAPIRFSLGVGQAFQPDVRLGVGQAFQPDVRLGVGQAFQPDVRLGVGQAFQPDVRLGVGQAFQPDVRLGVGQAFQPDVRLESLTYPKSVEGGSPQAAVWVFEDLTALHQAEAARLDTESRLRTILETMAEGVIVQDHAGRIIDCNSAACTIFGHPPEQLRGMTLGERDWSLLAEDGVLLSPEEYPAAIVLRMGRPVRNLILGLRHHPPSTPADPSSKDVRWILVNAMPLGASGGANLVIPGVVATYVDITASIQARKMIHESEEKYRELERDLLRAQRLELVGKLSSGIAHDFNNLLSVVLSLTELVSSALPAEQAVQADLHRIKDATEQAANLSNQLLTFSKQRRVVSRRIDVNLAVRRTLELLRATLPSRIELRADLAEQDLFVQADETQIQQVLMNLCLNGRDAMPEGGALDVRTAFVAGDGGWVQLSVRDHGTGISELAQEHLFDPFFSTKERGTGLGLAVVKQILDSQDGRIEVFTEPNRGAYFIVWWPLSKGEE